MFIGADFGSKRAGTTAIAYYENEQIHVRQSIKGEDADKFIRQYQELLAAEYLFLNAPLSLPIGFYQADSDELFYRKADRELGSMSPMFMGGITSRAMLLKKQFSRKGVRIYEVCPKALVKELELEKEYKKNLSRFLNELQVHCTPLPELLNWHQTDAVLAWLSGFRFTLGEATSYGNEEEGIIYV